MYFTKLLPFVILFFIACSSDPHDDSPVIPESKSALYFTNSKIDSILERNVIGLGPDLDGPNIVFQYTFQKEDHVYWADDEFSESVYFEIEPTEDSFEFDDDLNNQINLQYRSRCYGRCTIDYFPIYDGKVTGNKSGNIWDVQINITFELDERIEQSFSLDEMFYAGN